MQNEEIQNLLGPYPGSFCILRSAFCIDSPPLAALRLQYPQSLPWVILLLSVLALLILFVYPAQLRQIPASIRWLLPALRMVAVFAIGLSILRPVVTRRRVAAERAPVLVLFDNSASMGVIDSNRAPAEWVAIAAAMGKLPADARDKQLDAVQAGCDRISAQADDVIRARAELDYARLAGRGVDVAQARLDQSISDMQSSAHDTIRESTSMKATTLDRALGYLVQVPPGVDRTAWLDRIRERARAAAALAEQARIASDAQLFSRDSAVRDSCQPLQSLSRLRLSESAVLDPQTGFLSHMGTDASVLGFGISDRVIPIDLQAHRQDLDPLLADGATSNLTGGLRAVLESFKSSPPRAVVLFSDGRLTGADTDPATLSALQQVPIFTVGAATRTGLKDLSITSASVPSNATIGETITLNAELRCFGMRGMSADVTVTGGGPDESRHVTFLDERPVSVSFNRRFSSAGEHQLTLQMTSFPAELTTENNRIDRWVNVSAIPPRPGATTHPATRPAMEAEMADLTGDESWLRRLAESSGGQFLRLDQIDLLARRLAEIHDDVNHPVEIPLWDRSYLFTLVLGCLAAEWGMRKRYGLV